VKIAVVNVGSATTKAALVQVDEDSARVRKRTSCTLGLGDPAKESLTEVLEKLGDRDSVDAVAHRVVHGGRQFREPVRVDASVEEAIESLAGLAPLHNPLALEGMRAARAYFPERPMVAVFDTAFHSQRAPESLRYPLPLDVCEDADLVRYGFHGLAHASLTESLAQAVESDVGKVTAVTLQLGAGCSACAVEGGRSIETSMGFSPLGGLPMATRSGDLDPAVVLELFRRGWKLEELEDLLSRRSGLLAMGGSADMRELLRSEAAGGERASVALRLFVHRIVALVGAYLTLLRGRGALVFGGGIGTNSPDIRSRIAAGLTCWDIELDPARNASGAPGQISTPRSRPVYVFETNEERLIARSAYRVLIENPFET
jgi:acetate kinase